jgi:sulfopyruvate decarboxylase TPP-binding subunit
MANNEGDAVAIAAGESIGGKKSVELMQNSDVILIILKGKITFPYFQ